MEISSNSEYAVDRKFDINLAAAIQLKNIVEYHWRHVDEDDEEVKKPEDEISNEDKDFIKKHIIQALAHVPSLGVLAQYEEVVYVVAKYELPQKWPNALPEISALLEQQEERQVFGGLVALKEVVHKFEYEFQDNRKPLHEIVNKLFPRIEEIFTNLAEVHTEDAMRAKNIIMETFYLANQVKISNRYLKPSQFDALVNLVMSAFTQELPAEYTEKTDDADKIAKLIKSDPWQLKKNCMRFINRLFTQLADTEMVEEEYVKISKHFVTKHSKNFIELSLTIIDNYMTHFVANEIVSFAIRILSKTENIAELFKHLKPHQEDILFKYALPLIQLTPGEIEEFTENPVTYIRQQFDISDTLNSAKNSGIDLINYFVTYQEDGCSKDKPPYLDKYLNFLFESLNSYADGSCTDYKLKDSIILSLGHLSKEVIKFADLHDGIEAILKQHVFPELIGTNDMLKARALWIYGEMSNFVSDPEHAKKAVEVVYQCLLDDCLPVKVFAGTTLHKLSKIKEAKKILEPGVAEIIGAYLKAMNEIDQDELVNALEEIVDVFDDKIEPFAAELVHELNIRFKKVVKNEDENGGEAVLTANGCICAIRRIIAAVSKHPNLLEHIEEEIYPSILFCLTPDGLDYIEDSIDCAILLVYHRKFISEKMWKLFFHMFKIIIGTPRDDEDCDGGYGFEFIPIMLSFFQNCISFGGDTLFTYSQDGETAFELMTNSITKILEIEKNIGEMYSSSVCCMKLIGTILENCAGKVDNHLPDFITLLFNELQERPPSKIYKSSILQTFAMCFVYNTRLTYESLELQGQTEEMLKLFFSSMTIFTKTYEVRRVLYGISCIIGNDPREAPEILNSEIPSLMNVVVVLIDTYVRAKEKEIKKEIKEANKMKQINDQGFDDEDEFITIMAKLKDIKKNQGKLFDLGDEDDEEGFEGDEEGSEYDVGDELIYTAGDLELYDSPLEKVDAPIYFKNVMDHLNTTNPELYNMLVATITAEQNEQLNQNFAKNEELLKLEKSSDEE